jgi:hypothetical protein
MYRSSKGISIFGCLKLASLKEPACSWQNFLSHLTRAWFCALNSTNDPIRRTTCKIKQAGLQWVHKAKDVFLCSSDFQTNGLLRPLLLFPAISKSFASVQGQDAQDQGASTSLTLTSLR